MNLAIRDHTIFQMKSELENRKRMLCAKRRQLRESSQENELLKDQNDMQEIIKSGLEKYQNKQVRDKEFDKITPEMFYTI